MLGKLERFKRPLCMSVFRQIFCLEIFILCMELVRETGMERATSSVEIWTSIESKEQWCVMASTVEHQNCWIFQFPNLRVA